jgi:hypothetical protein
MQQSHGCKFRVIFLRYLAFSLGSLGIAALGPLVVIPKICFRDGQYSQWRRSIVHYITSIHVPQTSRSLARSFLLSLERSWGVYFVCLLSQLWASVPIGIINLRFFSYINFVPDTSHQRDSARSTVSKLSFSSGV